MALTQILIIFSIAFVSSNALTCYSCAGTKDDCKYPEETVCELIEYGTMFPKLLLDNKAFPVSNERETSGQKHACINIVTKYDVIRTCVYGYPRGLEYACNGIAENGVTCDLCSKHLCNSGYIFGSSSMLLFISFIVKYFN